MNRQGIARRAVSFAGPFGCGLIVAVAAFSTVVRAQTDVATRASSIVQSDTPVIVRLDHAPTTPEELALPLAFWSETQTEPEQMAAWLLRVDLQCTQFQVAVMTAADPDGPGPAEAVLTDPVELAHRFGALAAVNANGFAHLPGPDGKVEDGHWRVGDPVDIAGLAAAAGAVRSLPDAKSRGNNLCFWMDTNNLPHIGPCPATVSAIRDGVNAWWIDLVADGRVLPKPGGDRHPRTAVGLDATERWLLLAVVDGRQPRHSVGMTACELADLMAKHGCRRAINLDGGGSSVMLAADAAGNLQVINKPCEGKPRPLPVMLGIVSRR